MWTQLVCKVQGNFEPSKPIVVLILEREGYFQTASSWMRVPWGGGYLIGFKRDVLLDPQDPYPIIVTFVVKL